MKILLNKKNIITVSAFSILYFVLVFFLILPIFREIQRLKNEFPKIENDLSLLENKTRNLQEFKKFYQKNQTNLDKLDQLFINPEIPIEFINFLEKISQDSKILLKISLLSINESKDSSWPFLNFQISTEGQFSNFSKFLEKLESSPYLIEIQNLTINKLSKSEVKSKEFENLTSPNEISANLLIKVYSK